MRACLGRVLVVVMLFLNVPLVGADEGAEEARILVLMSYDAEDSWSQRMLRGLAAALDGVPHLRHVEFLDSRHFHGAEYFTLQHQLLEKKYTTYPPSLLVAGDDAAFAFLLEHRRHLDERLPLVFCGVNNFTAERLAGQQRVTGVNEAVDIPGTVNLGLRLFPEVKRLVVVASASGVGRINLATLRASVGTFTRAVAVTELLDLKRSAIQQLAGLSSDTMLLRLDNLREDDGSAIPLEESMRLLTSVVPVPVLTCWDFDIGHGALGGRVVSSEAQGRAAGRLVRRILQGVDPGHLPVEMDSPNEVFVDFQQLRRFHVDEALIPADARVVGKPQTLYDRYRLVIWGALGLFLVMGLGLLLLSSALIARRRAERALRTSEARYRTYTDEAPSGIFIVDADGRYLDVNPEACHITGYSRDELLARHVHELLPAEAVADGLAHFARVKALGTATGELPFRRKDGAMRWWSVVATALPDGTFLAHGLDVTERRQGEEGRAIFRQLLDNAEHIVVFKDTALRYVLVNRAYTALTGKTTADVLGKTDAEAFAGLSTPQQIAAYMDADRRALDLPPGQSLTVEEGTQAADGSTLTFLTKKFPVYSEDGRLLGTGTMTSEITGLKRVQQRLEASIDLLGTVMDAIPADIYVMDPETYTILFMNKAMQLRFGEDTIGRPCWQVLHDEPGPCPFCRLPGLQDGSLGETATWEEFNRESGRTFVNIDTMITWQDGRPAKLQVAWDISELRRVEAALVESEDRFRAIFEHAAIGISQRYLDGSGYHVNPRFCEILGYSPEELAGVAWRDISHPDDRRPSEIGLRRLLSGEIEAFSQEKRYLHRDGSTIWGNLTLSLQRGRDGAPLSLIACLEDVTQRRLDAEAMRTAADIIAQIPSGLFVYNYEPPDSLYLCDANPEATRLTGVAIDDWRGREFDEIWPAAENSHLKQLLLRPIVSGEPYETESVEYRDHRLSGAFRIRTFNLPQQRLAVAFEDVTEKKRAEAAAAASREELRQVIDLVPHFIFAKDLDGRYLLVNRTLAEAYGLTVAEMTGQFDGDVLGDAEELARLRELDREVMASGELRQTEVVVTLPGEETPRHYSSVRVPFTAFADDRPAVLGVSVDITEHRRDEEEKRRLTAQLHQAQKLEAIGTLAGGIAHDFNNILGAIIGYAEMLRDDSPAGSPAYNDSDQVLKAGMRAKELVRQILAFSRQSAFEKVALQPGAIVEEAVKLLRASLPATIVIVEDIENDCGHILADPTHLHQIVMNLGTNAFHAMEGGGGVLEVRLGRVSQTEELRGDVGRLAAGDYVRLSIADSGGGIAPEVRQRIFDPYFTTKEVGKGTGLGLATVQGIVAEYGGAVVCDSVLGQGTTFHVYLPASAAVAQVEEERHVAEVAGGEHILLVDDEPILADLGRAMLQRAGYRVTSRTSSLEALSAFQNQPELYDLVITDQTMPGMTGIDLARRLLQLRPGLPIILSTGYGHALSEERVRAMGLAGFAMKPLVKKDIVTLIRQVLEKRGR